MKKNPSLHSLYEGPLGYSERNLRAFEPPDYKQVLEHGKKSFMIFNDIRKITPTFQNFSEMLFQA